MEAANLRAALERRPFRPFELHFDGLRVAVSHPEQAIFAENRATVVVARGRRMHLLDLSRINRVAPLRRQKAGRVG